MPRPSDNWPACSSESHSPWLSSVFPGLKAQTAQRQVLSPWSQPSPQGCGPTVCSVQLPQPLSCFPCCRDLSSSCPHHSITLLVVMVCILIDYLEGEGRNGPPLAKNFLTISYVNSFRLSGPQYYSRPAAWRQSCD